MNRNHHGLTRWTLNPEQLKQLGFVPLEENRKHNPGSYNTDEWRIIREEALWHSLRFIIQNMNDEESEEMDAVISKTRRRLQDNKDSFDAARYAFHELAEKESEGLTPSSVPNFIHENLSRWVP